ncbi:hypothetical protein N2152v2_006910 [Parachlorella kessleri]
MAALFLGRHLNCTDDRLLAPCNAVLTLSWLRRRSPAVLPDALLHKLFRSNTVRLYDPSTGKVSRAAKSRELQPGAQLLIPQAVVDEAAQHQNQLLQSLQSARSPAPRSKLPAELTPEQQDLRMAWVRELRRRVLYHDGDLIAIDKPAGLAVQGGSGVQASVDDLMGVAFNRLVAEPADLRLVHRLDQATTGVLLIAKSPDAAAWLAEGFRGEAASSRTAAGGRRVSSSSSSSSSSGSGSGSGSSSSGGSREDRLSGHGGVEIRKTYYAVVVKQLPGDEVGGGGDAATPAVLPEQGEIDAPVAPRSGSSSDYASRGRHGGSSGRKGWEADESPAAAGVAAVTKFTLRRQNEQLAWLELRPQTGRKHQLRLHCAQSLKAPILGDSRYGAVRSPPQRQLLEQLREQGAWPERDRPPMFLHCRSVLIKKPGQRAVRVVAPPHAHWQALLRLQRWGGGEEGPRRAGGVKRQVSHKRARTR